MRGHNANATPKSLAKPSVAATYAVSIGTVTSTAWLTFPQLLTQQRGYGAMRACLPGTYATSTVTTDTGFEHQPRLALQ